MLSMPTMVPDDISLKRRFTRLDPMNPAAPVTRMVFPLMSIFSIFLRFTFCFGAKLRNKFM